MRAQEFQPKKLVIFDIDDTLVHTQTKVNVVKDGQVTKELNSHDFTHYKLQPGEQFDFANFRNAHDFFHNSKPIIPMMDQLKNDIATGNKVVMVTARADFDDKELFLDTFRKYGVDIDRVHVYRAGNMTGKMQTEEKKKIIIRKLLDQGQYTKAIMYDDAVPNLDSFVELKDEYPRTKFYAWHVSLEGEASEYHRTNESHTLEERRKKKRKPRNAAYGPGLYGGYGYFANYGNSDSASDGGGGDGGGGESIAESSDKKEAVLRIQKMLNAKYNANLDLDGVLGPLTRKSINKFMPNAQIRLADEPNKTTAVQGKNKKAVDEGIFDSKPKVDWNKRAKELFAKGFNEQQVAQQLIKEGCPPKQVNVYVQAGQLEENFADGKNPQDKGDSKRHGINTKASVSSLRKTAKSGGRKGQLAHWLANMKSGRAKNK